MSKLFTLKSAKVMPQKDGSDKHPDYGYSYWCYVKEIDLPVMFSSHSVIMGFETIIAEEMVKPKSGKDYWFLKKVKVAEEMVKPIGGSPAVPTPSAIKEAMPATDLSEINRKLDEIIKLLGDSVQVDKVVDVDKDEEIDLDGIGWDK